MATTKKSTNRHRLTAPAALIFAALMPGSVFAGVADLAWMTGSWAGPTGPGSILEENWTRPASGSIGALVRMSRDGVTSMVELIVVEEVADTLVLHIQQWDPGFQPRAGGAQRMELTGMGENTVSFRATSEGGLAALTYSRPSADTFTIQVELPDGSKFPIELKAQ
ncbi:MAG TPA: DUF6265 family protein [Pseudomonadales bacterium]